MAVELAPLRSLNEFLLEGARFQVPDVSDAQRLSNRIINNLLYYQTNYFVMAILVFLFVGIYHPVQMVTGIVIAAVIFAAFVQFTNNRNNWKRFKAQHPIVCTSALCLVIYFLTSLIGAVMVFFVGILTPLILTVLHASLRLRNINNKISRFKEYVGLKRTPMGVLLEGLGQEQEAGS